MILGSMYGSGIGWLERQKTPVEVLKVNRGINELMP